MERCYKCGISSDRAELSDALSGTGVVKACKNCIFHEHLVTLKKEQKKSFIPQQPPVKESSVRMGHDSRAMYERLAKLSGVKISERQTNEQIEIARQNKVLKDVAERNYKEKMMREKGDVSDLRENFNWILMRARRERHLSHSQLGEAIGEPEAAVRMAEQGVVPNNKVSFIKKLENYLRIKLFKSEVITEAPKLDFSSSARMNNESRSIKMGELKTKQEAPKPIERFEGNRENFDAENPEEELSEEDIDDSDLRGILFK